MGVSGLQGAQGQGAGERQDGRPNGFCGLREDEVEGCGLARETPEDPAQGRRLLKFAGARWESSHALSLRVFFVLQPRRRPSVTTCAAAKAPVLRRVPIGVKRERPGADGSYQPSF